MPIYSYWFLLALLLLGLEMTSGTFYLLMLSVAMAVGGLAALLAADIPLQLVLASLAAMTGTLVLRRWKSRQAGKPADISLDIGQPVQIRSWSENNHARVLYRGAEWDAETESADTSRDGKFYIKKIRGTSLILTHHKH